MSRILLKLNKQLETDYKKEAEDSLNIFNKLKELNINSVWSNEFYTLVCVFYPIGSNIGMYKPSKIGEIFLKGIKCENIN